MQNFKEELLDKFVLPVKLGNIDCIWSVPVSDLVTPLIFSNYHLDIKGDYIAMLPQRSAYILVT
jgi:hypothetical protein